MAEVTVNQLNSRKTKITNQNNSNGNRHLLIAYLYQFLTEQSIRLHVYILRNTRISIGRSLDVRYGYY